MNGRVATVIEASGEIATSHFAGLTEPDYPTIGFGMSAISSDQRTRVNSNSGNAAAWPLDGWSRSRLDATRQPGRQCHPR
jgi:hypothetical protein